MKWILEKLRRLFMPHIYELNPHLRPKKEPTIAKAQPKAAAPKKRGRPKGSKNKK